MRTPRTLVPLSLAAALAAQDVPAPEAFRAAREVCTAAVAAGGSPALSVAVLDRGEIVWAEGFGVADLANGRAASADTIYRLASISKPITATGLMLLVDRGVVDLDAPANRYLGDPGLRAYRGEPDEMTVRRLANHTAGLPTHWSFFYPGSTPPPFAETLRRYGFAAWTPGSRFNYSNLGFGILDHIVARVSDRPWREFMVTEVYAPLGMDRTDAGVRPGREGDAAVSYRRDLFGRFVAVADYAFDHPGASVIRSTARDLCAFARLHIGDGAVGDRRLLAAESAQAMRRATSGRDPRNGYGIGWAVGAVRGAQGISHSGGMPGVSTLLHVFPEQARAVAVLCNSGARGPVRRVTEAVLDVWFGSTAERTAAPGAPAADVGESAPAGTWRGRVAHFDGDVAVELTIGADGGHSLRFGGDVVRTTRFDAGPDSVAADFTGLLRTTAAFHGTPRLELRLERDGSGWSGVLYAEADATCRLPHWVELAPAGGG